MGKNIYVPVKGKIIDITRLTDEVFSEKMIGDGMAVIPEDEYICAPVDGIIESIYPTNHAFIVKDIEGGHILVHIGLDTVELNGEPFERILEVNREVKAGEAVIRSDYNLIRKKYLDPVVIVVAVEGTIEYKSEEISADTLDKVLFRMKD